MSLFGQNVETSSPVKNSTSTISDEQDRNSTTSEQQSNIKNIKKQEEVTAAKKTVATKPKRDKTRNDLPKGIYRKELKAGVFYTAQFMKNYNKVVVGTTFATPELAVEALIKRKAECEADPSSAIIVKAPKLLPKGVTTYNTKTAVRYSASLLFNNTSIFVGVHATPELASEALAKKKTECEADPTAAIKSKSSKQLPKGVYQIQNKNSVKYKALLKDKVKSKQVVVGTFETPELAIEAMARRQAKYDADPEMTVKVRARHSYVQVEQNGDGDREEANVPEVSSANITTDVSASPHNKRQKVEEEGVAV